MSPETILALLHHQLDSLYPELELACKHGHRLRITLYLGEEHLGEPQLTSYPRRELANSHKRVLLSHQ